MEAMEPIESMDSMETIESVHTIEWEPKDSMEMVLMNFMECMGSIDS